MLYSLALLDALLDALLAAVVAALVDALLAALLLYCSDCFAAKAVVSETPRHSRALSLPSSTQVLQVKNAVAHAGIILIPLHTQV